MTDTSIFHWTILKDISNKRQTFEPFKPENIDNLNVENCLELRQYSQAQNEVDNKSFYIKDVIKDFISYAKTDVIIDTGDFGKFNGHDFLKYICWFYNGKSNQLNFTWLLNYVYTPEKIDVRNGYRLNQNNRLRNPRIFKDQPELREYFIHDYGHNIYPFDSYNKNQIIEDLIKVYKP